ncbi:hypothetical protein BP5796_09971 [Coleophoma crateriformis]|uniref:Uncharacterized protein n=1 Tax=Coleophoma crateriformis TaxID=565419 RepID=A0A3D8QU12_9HELO|nr:hypothetical protein BP5796_09971 [Coleophoma crateriformis]
MSASQDIYFKYYAHESANENPCLYSQNGDDIRNCKCPLHIADLSLDNSQYEPQSSTVAEGASKMQSTKEKNQLHKQGRGSKSHKRSSHGSKSTRSSGEKKHNEPEPNQQLVIRNYDQDQVFKTQIDTYGEAANTNSSGLYSPMARWENETVDEEVWTGVRYRYNA